MCILCMRERASERERERERQRERERESVLSQISKARSPSLINQRLHPGRSPQSNISRIRVSCPDRTARQPSMSSCSRFQIGLNPIWKLRAYLILAMAFTLSCGQESHGSSYSSPIKEAAVSPNAYATILYVGTPRDYEYYIAARVLFRSLSRLNADADLVLLASLNTPSSWLQTFIKEGVRVVQVENIPNPYVTQNKFNRRFLYTLNKLLAWNLVEYQRVVMLDADNLILQNIDELFLCGEFCAAFINPCIFHTGLFVLEPSQTVFHDMLDNLNRRIENRDGADQGFLTSYYADLLDMPMFHHPQNGSRLKGQYRLPFGYQMDASYYYLKLKWRVPCGPNSVVTFPGASWLKPWYWWSWPILPLGLSWHDLRASTIGYKEEFPVLVLEVLLYASLLLTAICSWYLFPNVKWIPLCSICTPKTDHCLYVSGMHLIVKMTIPVCIMGSFLLPVMMVPPTAHPLAGWSLSLLGSLALLMVTRQIFRLPLVPMLTPWWLCFGSLLVMAFPYYTNGIIRGISIMAFVSFATPFLWWCLRVITLNRSLCIEKEPFKPQSVVLKLC